MRRFRCPAGTRPGSYDGRMALVRGLAQGWEEGLPLRTLTRILRRRGIHPWSLLPWVKDGERLCRDLRIPPWAAQAGLGSVGFLFSGLEKEQRLPKGLVSSSFEFVASPGLRSLPRRLCGFRLEVAECPRVETLPRGATGFQGLFLVDCPSFRALSGWRKLEWVEIRRCARFTRLDAARRLQRLELTSLPELAMVPRNLTIVNLEVWNGPALEALEQLEVLGFLKVQGCHALTSLPRGPEGLEGRVWDCPRLPPGPWAGEHRQVVYAPLAGSSALPPAQAPPGRQPAIARPLPGLGCEDPAPWPWPPPCTASVPVPAPMVGMLRALGMGPLEQAHCLAAPAGLLAAVRSLLLAERNPGAAVDLAVRMLQEAGSPGEGPVAQIIFLALEELGLGTRSALLRLEKDDVRNLEPVLGRDECGHYRRNRESLARVARSAQVLEGPLVLVDPAHPWADRPSYHTIQVTECPEFRELRGPLWAGCDLRILDCPDLEVLPGLMVVHGDLVVADCPALRSFPARLQVDGDLILARLPRLTAQACRAEVGGRVRVERVPGLELTVLPPGAAATGTVVSGPVS